MEELGGSVSWLKAGEGDGESWLIDQMWLGKWCVPEITTCFAVYVSENWTAKGQNSGKRGIACVDRLKECRTVKAPELLQVQVTSFRCFLKSHFKRPCWVFIPITECKYIFNSVTAHLGLLCFPFLKTAVSTFHWAAFLRTYWRTAEIPISLEPTRCPNLPPVPASLSHCKGKLQYFSTGTVQPITKMFPSCMRLEVCRSSEYWENSYKLGTVGNSKYIRQRVGEEKGEHNIRFSMHFWLCKESVTTL